MLQPTEAHENIGDRGDEQAATAAAHRIHGSALFPHDGHALNGHRDDDHRKQGNRQACLHAHLVGHETDNQHKKHHDDQNGTQPRHQQQAQALQQEADTETERNQDRKQHDSPDQLRLAKGERDQDGHERAECIDADDVAHHDHHERTDRYHQQYRVHRLGLYRQAVERKVEHRRAALRRLRLRDGDCVEMSLLHREIDLDVAAALDGDELLVASPPDKEAIRKVFLAGRRVEKAPAITVMNLQPRLKVRVALAAAELEAANHSRRNACRGKHHRGHVHEISIAFDLGHQQLDVRVRRRVVQAPQQLGRERGGIGRVLAHFRDDDVDGCPERFVDRGRWRERWRGVGLLAAFVLEHRYPVVNRLASVGTADRPLCLTSPATVVEAETVTARDGIFVERPEAGRQCRNVQVDLDGTRTGVEADRGFDRPDGGFLILGQRKTEDLPLVDEHGKPDQRQQHGEYQHISLRHKISNLAGAASAARHPVRF